MSKKRGPFLITDLASKLGSAPSPTRSTKLVTDIDHARNAYGFIAENYKKTADVSDSPPPLSSSAADESGSNRVQIRFAKISTKRGYG